MWGIVVAKLQRLVIEVALDIFQSCDHRVDRVFHRNEDFRFSISTGQTDGAFLQIFGSELQSYRHAFELPIIELEPWGESVTVVRVHVYAACFEFVQGFLPGPLVPHPFDRLYGRWECPTTWMGASLGGNTSPLSSEWVMMRPPTRRVETPQEVLPDVLPLAVFVLKLDVKCGREILS